MSGFILGKHIGRGFLSNRSTKKIDIGLDAEYQSIMAVKSLGSKSGNQLGARDPKVASTPTNTNDWAELIFGLTGVVNYGMGLRLNSRATDTTSTTREIFTQTHETKQLHIRLTVTGLNRCKLHLVELLESYNPFKDFTEVIKESDTAYLVKAPEAVVNSALKGAIALVFDVQALEGTGQEEQVKVTFSLVNFDQATTARLVSNPSYTITLRNT